MARRVIEVLTDDLDGGDADVTMRFSLDGVEYEIDLSKKNAIKLREVLGRYIGAGRKLRGAPAASPRRRRAPVAVPRQPDRWLDEAAPGTGKNERPARRNVSTQLSPVLSPAFSSVA
jgi:hypothetical protein